MAMRPAKLPQVFRSARTWIALSILAPVGMLVVSGLMLLDLRRDAWGKAEQTSRNLLQVIERDIARNVEIFDLSINAVIENLRTPGLDAVGPAIRQLVLFDRAVTARDMGVMLVINERGDVVEDAGAVPPRKGNYADREYFQAQRLRSDRGFYLGKPIVSRLTGEPMLPFSRRVSKSDGSFGGVVLISLKLSYFTRLFDQLGLGREGAINLYLRDGTRVMRYPYAAADIGVNIAGAPTFERFASSRSGSFVDISVRDGVERYYTFTQVGDLPLILNVALSTREMEAEWRAKALGIGAVVLILCGLTVALSLLFGKELRRRSQMQAELARLSETDTLTGLANRRRFDEAFSHACAQVARSGKPLSLLMIDADHFKRFNDRYGHEVGDSVLKGLARCLAASVHRPCDLVCRVGGEEFVLLLPETDATGALRVAEAVHTQVATLAVEAAGIGPGGITVSIGAATGTADARSVYASADAALYEAKAGGRNQTRCAPSSGTQSSEKPSLRLVER